jgi:pimeloyl-ACP methyl ester carboxylesterase
MELPMNLFPQDFEANLTGFGGDRLKNKAEHRSSIRKTPVILVHGNAAHSAHPKWGMETMKGFFKDTGYQDCEIWAMDYLGENNTATDFSDPHRNHIAQFRTFIKRVKDYLGVTKVDFIAHSLGCGMVNGFLRGLQPDGRWNNDDHGLDMTSTFVSLAGATYGLGLGGQREFRTGSAFEVNSHVFANVVDDTPRGENDVAAQESPVGSWKKTTSLDNDEIRYVAITSTNDFVDAQNRDTGRREGADRNLRLDFGGGIDGHEKIIKSRTTFAAFQPYLNKNPPVAPAIISVDKESGSYGSGLEITVSVNPAAVPIDYVAERVTVQFNGGFIGRTVAETRPGTLSNNQSLTLDTDGQWQVSFRAAGADEVRRTYGVNILMPEVTILTANTAPFRGTLDVSASTTRGTIYNSTNRENWVAGAVITINRATTVSFIAIDSDGIASPVESRAFEKELAEDRQTATLTEHFIARRLTVEQYVTIGQQLGFNAVITLYRIDGAWTLNPETVRTALSGLLPVVSLATAPSRTDGTISIRADKPNGKYTDSFEVSISASGPAGEAVTVYYTDDGTDPSDRNNASRHSFDTGKTITISGNGHHSILCYTQNGAHSGVFEAFAWSIDD